MIGSEFIIVTTDCYHFHSGYMIATHLYVSLNLTGYFKALSVLESDPIFCKDLRKSLYLLCMLTKISAKLEILSYCNVDVSGMG